MTEKKNLDRKGSSRWVRLKKHLTINRPLLPLKAVTFLVYGASTVFLPYITLHMMSIGITIEEVGVIYAILPFASCFGPPIAGMIADRIGNYKVVLMGAIFAMAGLHTLLLTIDAQGFDKTSSAGPYLHCDASGGTRLEWNNSCSNNDTCPYEEMWLANPTILYRSLSDCVQSCDTGNKTTFKKGLDVCLLEENNITDGGTTDNCHPSSLSMNEKIQLTLVRDDSLIDIVSEDLCSIPVDQLTLYNTSTVAELSCGCSVRCRVSLTEPLGKLTCQPEYDHAKHRKGFWSYLIIRIFATASLGTTFVMLDASTICLIRKHKGELGKQRLFGVIGSAVFGICSGFLLDWAASLNNGVRDYAITFYFADVLFLLVLLLLIFMEVTAEKSGENFFKNVLKLVRMVHIDIFMVMMLLLGSLWGFLEAFLFIFLIELKASSQLLGWTVALGSLVGLPFLFISDIIVKKIGSLVLLISAFFIYSIRFIGYSFIQDPWMSLPFECLEAVTIHLMGISCSIYCATAAPNGLLATLQGVAGSFHYSIGRGTGSFVGGVLIASYGTRITFQIFGTSASIFGVIFIILYYTIMRKSSIVSLKQKSIEEKTKSHDAVFHPIQNFEEDLDVLEYKTKNNGIS